MCQNRQVLDAESNLKFPSESLYIIMEMASFVHISLTLHDTEKRKLKGQDIWPYKKIEFLYSEKTNEQTATITIKSLNNCKTN